MLDSLITLPHFSNSTLACRANSSGVLATGSKPSTARRALTSGNAMISTISRWMKSIAAFGVPLGTIMPCQLSPATAAQPAFDHLLRRRRGRGEANLSMPPDRRTNRQTRAVERHVHEVETKRRAKD